MSYSTSTWLYWLAEDDLILSDKCTNSFEWLVRSLALNNSTIISRCNFLRLSKDFWHHIYTTAYCRLIKNGCVCMGWLRIELASELRSLLLWIKDFISKCLQQVILKGNCTAIPYMKLLHHYTLISGRSFIKHIEIAKGLCAWDRAL